MLPSGAALQARSFFRMGRPEVVSTEMFRATTGLAL